MTIRRNNPIFPFSRVVRNTEEALQRRQEIEDAIAFLERQLDELTELVNSEIASLTAGDSVVDQLASLQEQISSLQAQIVALSSSKQNYDETLQALSGLTDSPGKLTNDGSGNLSWKVEEFLSVSTDTIIPVTADVVIATAVCTLTLPQSALRRLGHVLTIIADATSVTIAAYSGEVVDDSASIVIYDGEIADVYSNGAGAWKV